MYMYLLSGKYATLHLGNSVSENIVFVSVMYQQLSALKF